MTEDASSTGADPPDQENCWRAVSDAPQTRGNDEYRMIRRLGEGGFGEVWLAEQEGALPRPVAIKFFKQGMHAEEAVSRFHAERRLLAALDHPGIATVFDAGMTAEGRPFFVMEFINGLPLSDYCRQRQMSLRQCVRLGIEVCDAVQHAHQRTVLHRDLKPANVLVREDAGGQAEVKVIDFGIGKALGDDLLERTLWTLHGEVLGTPDYMSPEQAEGNPARIDVRTDIFSIGAMLYELLTGCTPLQAVRHRYPECRQAGFLTASHAVPGLGVARRCLATAPPAPATPRAVAEPIDRDLEAVVMKACEVEMKRRYATVAELAEDLHRWLELRPVCARPQTTAYRLGKLVRRRPGMVFVAAGLVLAIAGWAGTGYHLAERADHARREALRERDHAEARRKEAEEARQTAQQAQTEAKATSDLLLQALSNPVSNTRGVLTTVVEVLDTAAQRVRQDRVFSPVLRATLLHTLGATQFHYQRHKEALASLEEAWHLRRLALGLGHAQTLQTGILVGRCYALCGQRKQAVAAHEVILRQAELALGRTHLVTNEARNYLGVSLYYAKDHQRAAEMHRENLDIRRKLHGTEHRLVLASMDELSANLANIGHFQEAVELLEDTLPKLLRLDSPSAPTHTILPARLAAYYLQLGQSAKALVQAETAVASAYRIYGPMHAQSLFAVELKLKALVQLDRRKEITATCADHASRVESLTGLISPEQRRMLPTAVRRWTEVLQPAGHEAAVQPLQSLAARLAPASDTPPVNVARPASLPASSPSLDLAEGWFAGCRPGTLESEAALRLAEHGITELRRGEPEPSGNYRVKLPQHPCMELTFRADGLLLRIHWTNRQPSVPLPEGLAPAELTRQALEARYGKSQPKSSSLQGRPMGMIPMGGHEIWFEHDADGHIHACAIRSRIWDLPRPS